MSAPSTFTVNWRRSARPGQYSGNGGKYTVRKIPGNGELWTLVFNGPGALWLGDFTLLRDAKAAADVHMRDRCGLGAAYELDQRERKAMESQRAHDAALGNRVRHDGADRCSCGCKYWENDRCVDCGATEPEKSSQSA